ncbi:MAG: LamG domain-containing protein [Candidatus Paceibacterota bacterium]|jgi:prepilin-type N-terminal cleavage/methylation domain-containing protein|nr:LamG domain-containing protein [Candidatus Paceibacterota bacterium]
MNKSFTLIEILVVIVIIGIISAFIIVSMSGVSEKARIAKSQAFSNSIKNSLMLNLVSEWRMDDASGTTAQDHWGANPGTWFGAGGGTYTSPSWRTASECVSGGCLAFDGTDDYVNCGSGASLNIIGPLTISVWVKPSLLAGDNRRVAGKGTTDSYEIGLDNNGYPRFDVDFATSGLQSIIGTTAISLNSWHHIVGTYNSSTMKLYYDGAVTGTPVSMSESITVSSTDFLIGKRSSHNDDWFNGLIDDVRIYNAAIPISQIQQNYYLGLNKLLFNEGVAFEEFNQRLAELKNNLANN